MKLILLLGLIFLAAGCAGLGQTISDVVPFMDSPTKYSDVPQMSSPAERKYQRMNRSQMEEEAQLQADAGSMWVMEGQSSYLFAQNKARKEGDSLNVKLEGAGQKQVETKVTVIKKLLKELEAQKMRRPASMGAAKPAETPAAAAAATPADGTAAADPKAEGKPDLSDVAVIPAKITEKTPDGLYRVKGSQPLMIDDREFKVILTGLIKADDYTDEGVSSSKLIDPQYDVVSIRRNGRSALE